MNFDETDLLTAYQLILLCAAIPALVVAVRGVRKWVARYQQLPRIWQQPIKQGLHSAVKHFIWEEWPRLIALTFLLLILIGLTIAVRMV